MTRWAATAAASAWLVALTGCSQTPEPQTPESLAADGTYDPCSAGPRIEHGAQTAGQAAKTGATTAWEGMKTFGKSVGGFVEGGTEEAAEEWDEGADKTRKKGREGGRKTKATAKDNPCP